MGSLSAELEAVLPALVELRRDLHREPELAYAEHKTAARVASFLAGSALQLRTGLAGTGIVAEIAGAAAPALLMRVDMDGLPIQEAGEADYRSRVPGAMHACGHDGHTAIGAVAARLLAQRPAGPVRVLFQPAEEGEGGAQAMVRAGVMDGIDLAVGIHLWNELPLGTIGVKPGPLMAAVDRLRIRIHGRGGHGAQPQRVADPIVATAHVVTALQSVVSREVSPLQSAVVTIAAVHGGDAFNVIPDQVTLLGTLRTFDPELRAALPERIRRLADGVAAGLKCRAEVEVSAGNPAVINDAGVAALARRAALRVVGAAGVVEPEPTMGGEDMAVYFQRAPGCFVFIGSANPERGLDQPHHSPRFDFDEAALGIGCQFLLEVAAEARGWRPTERP